MSDKILSNQEGYITMDKREELLERLNSSTSNLNDEELQSIIDYVLNLKDQRIQ